MLKIQHPRDGFESPMDRIRISISKSEETEIEEGDLNPLVQDSNPFQTRNSKSAFRQKKTFLSMFQTFFGFSISEKNE